MSTLSDRLNGVSAGMGIKVPCRTATTAAITLSGLQTVGGVVLDSGDRVLVKDQTNAIENGIYVASDTVWERAKDFEGSRAAVSGTLVLVSEGGGDTATAWVADIGGRYTIGSDEVAFTQTFDSAYSAASPIVLSGSAFGLDISAARAALSISNVEDKSSATIRSETTAANINAALGADPLLLSGGTMLGNLTLVGDPSSALHPATKQYVDGLAQGLQIKTAVACATTANIMLSGEQTIDGVLTSASRVLVKSQSTSSQNGIYVSAAGAWARATDLDAWSEVIGAYVYVSAGTANGNSGWAAQATAGGTIGTTSMPWVQFSAAGTYAAGSGLALVGSTFSLDVAGATGASLMGTAVDDVNAATRTVRDKLRERISVSDFSGATDSIKLQRAINFASARGGYWDVVIDGSYTVGNIDSAANVRLTGGKLTATSGVDRIINIAASSDYFIIDGVIFDGLLLEDTGSPTSTAACIYQNSGVARSVGLAIVNNRFAVRNNDGAAYCASLLNDCSGEFAGNYSAQCGGDTFNFNGGFWNIHHNMALNGGDGGIAMNNGAGGRVDSNYVYKCSLGVGSGPNGTTASPFTNIEIVNNVIEACEYGVLAGWFSFAGREGPQYAKISGNKIVKPRLYGIRFDGQATTPYMSLQISDNQIMSSGSSAYNGSTGTGSGIGLFGASGSMVQDNQVIGGLGNAFYFDGNFDVMFDGNIAISNSGYGVVWANTNSAHVGSFHETSNTLGRSSGVPSNLQSGVIEFTGTTNGSGTVTIAHNLGATEIKRIVPGSVVAHVQQTGNVYYQMALAYIDGTNMQFTSAIASRPVAASLTLRVRAYSNY